MRASSPARFPFRAAGYHPGTSAVAPTAGRDPYGGAAHPQYAYAPLPYPPYGQPQGYGHYHDGAVPPHNVHYPQPPAVRHDLRDSRPRPAGEPKGAAALQLLLSAARTWCQLVVSI